MSVLDLNVAIAFDVMAIPSLSLSLIHPAFVSRFHSDRSDLGANATSQQLVDINCQINKMNKQNAAIPLSLKQADR